MLQWGAPWVKGVVEVIVEQAAEGGHVDVGEAAEAAGEIRGVVAGAKDAAKLRVEEVLGKCPAARVGRERRKEWSANHLQSSGYHSQVLFLAKHDVLQKGAVV